MWVDGYWHGEMIDGYPASYFQNGQFEYPWAKDLKKKQEEPVKKDKIVLDLSVKCDIVANIN